MTIRLTDSVVLFVEAVELFKRAGEVVNDRDPKSLELHAAGKLHLKYPNINGIGKIVGILSFCQVDRLNFTRDSESLHIYKQSSCDQFPIEVVTAKHEHWHQVMQRSDWPGHVFGIFLSNWLTVGASKGILLASDDHSESGQNGASGFGICVPHICANTA